MEDKLATTGTASLAAIPEHLRSAVGSHDGKENVGKEDLLIPRLCVAQALSPQLKKDNEAFIRGLQVGDLFNSVTGRVYGEKVRVIPLFFFKQYIHFTPMSEGGGIVAQYQKESEVPRELLEWKDGRPPVVTEFKNRMVCVEDPETKELELAVLSFKSTGMKFAKKLNSLIMMVKNLPAYAKFYVIKSVKQSKGQQEWYGMAPFPDEWVPAAFFEAAKGFFQQLQDGGYKVDVSGIEEEREPGSDDGESAPY